FQGVLFQAQGHVVVELDARLPEIKRLEVIRADVVVGVQIDCGQAREELAGVDSLEAELFCQVLPECVRDNIQPVAMEAEARLVDESWTEDMDLGPRLLFRSRCVPPWGMPRASSP